MCCTIHRISVHVCLPVRVRGRGRGRACVRAECTPNASGGMHRSRQVDYENFICISFSHHKCEHNMIPVFPSSSSSPFPPVPLRSFSGTGNYVSEVIHAIGSCVAQDFSEGMLDKARAKFKDEPKVRNAISPPTPLYSKLEGREGGRGGGGRDATTPLSNRDVAPLRHHQSCLSLSLAHR